MASFPSLSDQQQHTLAVAGVAAVAALATARFFSAKSSSSSSTQSLKPRSAQDDALNPDPAVFERQCFTRLLAAFGSSGLNAPGASPGAMIASPSRPSDRWNKTLENDNYFFQWPRDSGLCVRMVVRRWARALEGGQVGMPGGRDWLAGALRRARKGQVLPNATDLARLKRPSENADEIEQIIQDFAMMNLHLQHLENPSGTFQTDGLGEPKFEVDGTPFTGSWGRPQNDGPALRSMALLSYARHIMLLTDSDHPSHQFVFDHLLLHPSSQNPDASPRLINSDLDYICRVWREGGYDPWEEVNAGFPDPSDDTEVGGHFYVLMVQRQALLFGAEIATSIGDVASASRWRNSATEIASALEDFWNPTGQLGKEGNGTDGPLKETDWNDPRRHLLSIPQGLRRRPHIVPTLHRRNGQPKPTQADVQTLLAYTHGGDGTWFAAEEDSLWAPWSDRALASLDRLVEVFKIVYDLNQGRDTTKDGVLCGRYPEDVYDGKQKSVGHPWFICTHAIAEVLSLSANHFAEVGTFTPTEHSLRFFQRFHPNLQPGKAYRKAQDGEFEPVLRGMRSMAKAYLDYARSYAGPEGRMDEQVDRVGEMMRGARELTWSFASFLSAWDAVQNEGPDT